MKANFIKATATNRVSIGSLYALESLREEFAPARYLEGNLPVLSCMVSKEDVHLLGTGNAETCVGYGRIELDDGHQLQTIQVQIGNLFLVWVADMADADVWAAIDVWRSVGQLPLMLRLDKGTSWQGLCAVLRAPTGALGNDIYRDDEDLRSTSERVSQLFEIVSNGRLQKEARGLIPGAPLRHVFGNALLTERVKQLVDVSKLVPPAKRAYGL
jgi:hypothetical protein